MEKDKFKVIKISKDALWELIYETINDKIECYFDISDVTEVIKHHRINWETGEYICLVHKDNEDYTLDLNKSIDLFKLLMNMEDTTDSLYKEKRYIELSLDDIKKIQSEKRNKN